MLFRSVVAFAQAFHSQIQDSRFEDISRQSGLTLPHIPSPDKRYIVESMTGGVGLIDCDGDGHLDILAVNGSRVDRYRESGGNLMLTLYYQDAGLKFTDITITIWVIVGSKMSPRRPSCGRGLQHQCGVYRRVSGVTYFHHLSG